jgi:hypothetical protein
MYKNGQIINIQMAIMFYAKLGIEEESIHHKYLG